MWYDATSAAGSLGVRRQPNKGKFGYVAARSRTAKPAGSTPGPGPSEGLEEPGRLEKFIAWASSKEYEELVGKELGWSRVPAGKRSSTLADRPEGGGAFAEAARPRSKALTQQRRRSKASGPGYQFIGIPGSPTSRDQGEQLVNNAIAGQTTVDQALDRARSSSGAVSAKYRK